MKSLIYTVAGFDARVGRAGRAGGESREDVEAEKPGWRSPSRRRPRSRPISTRARACSSSRSTATGRRSAPTGSTTWSRTASTTMCGSSASIAELHGAVRHQRQPGGRRRPGAARTIKDDPVKQSNKRGYVTFATDRRAEHARPRSSSSTTGTTTFLDTQGFAPFGEVTRAWTSSTRSTAATAKEPERRAGSGPLQQGNAYLTKEFPKLDYIKTATIAK